MHLCVDNKHFAVNQICIFGAGGQGFFFNGKICIVKHIGAHLTNRCLSKIEAKSFGILNPRMLLIQKKKKLK